VIRSSSRGSAGGLFPRASNDPAGRNQPAPLCRLTPYPPDAEGLDAEPIVGNPEVI
jgi:hypothetical protein